jgi:hypothetical protein
MAEDYNVLKDLQSHLRTAKVPIDQLSTLAQQGDDKVYVNRAVYPFPINDIIITA